MMAERRAYMKKGFGDPEPLSLCAPGSSGGDSASLLLHDLRFGAEPVVQRMAVFPAACLVEFLLDGSGVRPLVLGGHGRLRFLRGICIHGGTPSAQTYASTLL